MTPEGIIKNRCLNFLQRRGIFAWNNPTGMTKIGDRYLHFGKKGSSDIIGCLPDGSIIDLTTFDWGEHKLTEREKLFAFWYAVPNTATYHNAHAAAIKAGYSKKTAERTVYWLILKPHIQKAIEKIEQNIKKTSIDAAYFEFVQLTMRRAEFDIADYYESYTYTDSVGNERKGIRIKDIESLTAEQRQIVCGIDYRSGHPLYILPDKRKEMDLIMRLYQEARGEGQSGNGMNVDFTLDAVRERISASVSMRKAQSEIKSVLGDYYSCSADVPEED